MKYEDYKEIYFRLRKFSDIDRLTKSMNLDRELLLVLYTQRTVRDATKRFHLVKAQAPNILKKWKSGKSMAAMAKELNFPPVLLGLIVFQLDGMPRKTFWKYIKDPNSCNNQRMKKEMEKINKADMVYSPAGMEIQEKRGVWGEKRLQDWLGIHRLGYKTEEDLRGKFPKTPDVLLDHPIELNGTVIKWIESKASFGDEIEIRKNARRQLKPYTELFGKGAVVYWFGYIEGLDPPEGVTLFGEELAEMMPVKVDRK